LSLAGRARSPIFDIEMIGATADAIDKAEDRQLFRNAMERNRPADAESRLANASA